MNLDNTITVNIFLFLLYVIFNFTKYEVLKNVLLFILILINHKNKSFSILLMLLFMSTSTIKMNIDEGFSDKQIEENVDTIEEQEDLEKMEEENKKQKNENNNDLIIQNVKDKFIKKMLKDNVVTKTSDGIKESFVTNISKYNVNSNVDQKINQLDQAIQLFKKNII